MENYYFKLLNKENAADLVPIYENAFEKKIKSDFFFKKINTAALGEFCVGFIAYDQYHNPAAFYGVYPCKIEYKGNYFMGAQAGDTMTHSAHSGKGLFTRLAMETQKLCIDKGFHLLFAFPNENSLPGFVNKLGWVHFDNITPYLIRVICVPWIMLKNTFRLPPAIHNSWCNFILSRLKKGNPFKSSCFENDTPVVDHSTSFFEYKTYSENYLLEFHGINIWLKFDTTFLIIGDIEKCNEKSFLKIIKRLKKIAFILGLPHLKFQTSTNTWALSMFKKYGFPMDLKYPVVGVNFTNEIPLDQLKFTGADNDTF